MFHKDIGGSQRSRSHLFYCWAVVCLFIIQNPSFCIFFAHIWLQPTPVNSHFCLLLTMPIGNKTVFTQRPPWNVGIVICFWWIKDMELFQSLTWIYLARCALLPNTYLYSTSHHPLGVSSEQWALSQWSSPHPKVNLKPDQINVPHSIPISSNNQGALCWLPLILQPVYLSQTSVFRQDESDFWTKAFSQVWIISLASSSAHHTDEALQISSRCMVLLPTHERIHSQVLGCT